MARYTFLSLCVFHISLVNFNCYFLQYDTGQYLESLAIELVVLAIWKKALDICSTSLDPITESSSQTTEQKVNFSDPPSVSLWAKHGFIVAVDRAERLSCHVQNMDGI